MNDVRTEMTTMPTFLTHILFFPAGVSVDDAIVDAGYDHDARKCGDDDCNTHVEADGGW